MTTGEDDDVLILACRLVDGNNVDGIDGVRNTFLINDHHNLRIKCNEIAMRNHELAAVGQANCEGSETVSKAVSNLI